MNQEKNSKANGGIDDIVKEGKKVVKKISTLRTGMSPYLKQLKDGLGFIKSIDLSILEIHDYSEIMELLALNSMVFSLRAGKNIGFVYISDILKDNARSSIRISEDIANIGNSLRERFRYLEEIGLSLKKSESYTDFIKKKIESQETVINDIEQYYNENETLIREEVSSLKQDLLHMVQEIQYQDIFQQSMNHIVLLLEGKDIKDFKTPEHRLDYLCYLETVCDFSIPLLQEILLRVQGSASLFHFRLKFIVKRMERMSLREKVICYDKTHRTLKKGGLIRAIKDFRNSFLELNKELNSHIKSLNRLKNELDKTSYSMNVLQGKTVDLEEAILSYYNITRLGRQEILKYPELDNLKDNLENIQKLSKNIEKKGVTIQKAIVQVAKQKDPFCKETEELIAKKKKFVTDNESVISLMDNYIGSLDSALNQRQIEYQREIDFFKSHILKKNSTSLDFHTIIKQMEMIIQSFEVFKMKISNEKESLLNKKGLKEWKIKSEEIIKLLDKFTINRQKLAISQLTGLSQKEDSLKEGTVILF